MLLQYEGIAFALIHLVFIQKMSEVAIPWRCKNAED